MDSFIESIGYTMVLDNLATLFSTYPHCYLENFQRKLILNSNNFHLLVGKRDPKCNFMKIRSFKPFSPDYYLKIFVILILNLSNYLL